MDKQSITERVLKDDTLVIHPGRLLDNNNAHVMAEAIASAQANGYKFIIIEMTGLEFLSSAGVGSILSNVETAREMGGDIVLCGVPGTILQVLEVCDLTDYLTIRPGEKEAAELCGIVT